MIRLPRDLSKAIDDWKQANQIRGRSDAIRQLLEIGFDAGRSKPVSTRLRDELGLGVKPRK